MGEIWNLDFPKGGIAQERLNTSGLDYMEKIYFCVIESSKTRKMYILVHLKVPSMLLLIHQPLLKVTLKMKTLSFDAMMIFTQQEPLQYFFRI